jgi:uncharacterized protein
MTQEGVAQIGFGQVRHTRLRPRRHAFVYDTFFLMLPMRLLGDAKAMGGLAVNRRAVLSFHDSDHGDGRGPQEGGALGWMEELLRAEGIHDADGEIWLHTYPRMWGYAFKPVSFWYCHRLDGSLRAVVAEVHNTFGERHCYLLERPHYGVELKADKCFHVSPFCRVEGSYRFRFMRTGHPGGRPARTVVRVEHDDAQGPLLQTSVSGTLQAITPTALRQALWRYPAMSLMVILRIHWQALQIWIKRVGFHRKPQAPDRFVTR